MVNTLIACDEVGRGCGAGPVVVCASVWKFVSSHDPQMHVSLMDLVADSKKLSAKKRNLCFQYAEALFPERCVVAKYHLFSESDRFNKKQERKKKGKHTTPLSSFDHFLSTEDLHKPKTSEKIYSVQDLNWLEKELNCSINALTCTDFSVGFSTAVEIDRINIWNAVQLACGRALQQLEVEKPSTVILMDGHLPIKVPKSFVNMKQIAAVDADVLFKPVSFSSVVAKVLRDDLLCQLAEIFSPYKLDRNKGYLTKDHIDMIKENGITPIHRRSFLTKIISCQNTDTLF